MADIFDTVTIDEKPQATKQQTDSLVPQSKVDIFDEVSHEAARETVGKPIDIRQTSIGMPPAESRSVQEAAELTGYQQTINALRTVANKLGWTSDPKAVENDVIDSLIFADKMGIEPSKAMTFIDPLREAAKNGTVVDVEQMRGSWVDYVKEKKLIGDTQGRINKVMHKWVTTGDPQYLEEAQKISGELPEKPLLSPGTWASIVGGTAEQWHNLTGAGIRGLERGGPAAVGVGLIASYALGSGNPAVQTAAVGALSVGTVYGAYEYSMEQEAGSFAASLKFGDQKYMDEQAAPMSDEYIRYGAFFYGNLSAVFEVAELGILLDSFAGGKRAFKDATLAAVQEQIKSGRARELLLAFASNYGETLSKEVGTEMSQRLAEDLTERMTKYLSNTYDGSNVSQDTITESINAMKETIVTSARDFSLLSAMGPTFNAIKDVGALRQNAQLAQAVDATAKKLNRTESEITESLANTYDKGRPNTPADMEVLTTLHSELNPAAKIDEDTQTILDALDTPEADVTPQTIEDALASGATDEQIADALLGKTAEKVGITEGVVSTGQPAQFTQTAEQQSKITQAEPITSPQTVVDVAKAAPVVTAEAPTRDVEVIAEAQPTQTELEAGRKPYDLNEDGEIPIEMKARLEEIFDRVRAGDRTAEKQLVAIYKDHLESGVLSGVGWKEATGNNQYQHEMLFDLDDFKSYNDEYGYEEADRILRAFGIMIKTAIDEFGLDAVGARTGGDEFRIALQSAEEAAAIKYALTKAAEEFTIDLKDKETGELRPDVKFGFSVGDAKYGDKTALNTALGADKDRRVQAGLRKDLRGQARDIADEIASLRESLNSGVLTEESKADIESRLSRILGQAEGTVRLNYDEVTLPQPPSQTLGTEGAIDLNAEVSLAPILARLRKSINSPATAMSDILALGRGAWAEGKTRLSDFTARMQQVLGDMYASFKDVVRRAWGIINNREGSATLWPGVEVNDEGDPQINVQQRLADLAKYVASAEEGGRVFGTEGEFVGAYGSTFPDFMRDMGWRKDRVLPALEHAVKGEPLTENQREYVVAALAQVHRDWIRSVMNTEGQFIDFTETHSADEIHDIATEGIEAFVKTLKMFKPSMEAVLKSELRAERAAAFEANKKIDRVTRELAIKTSEIWNLQDALESEQVEGKESAKRIREAIKETSKRLKEAIREEGQRRVPTVAQAQRASMDIFTELTAEEAAQVRAAIVEQLAIARTARSQGRTLEAQAARERTADIRENARTTARRRKLVEGVKRQVKKLRKYKGSSIAVDYQKRILAILEGIDLAKPTQKTLDSLREFAEWGETQIYDAPTPEEPSRKLGILSTDRIKQLKRLAQRPIAEFTDVELKELSDTLKSLVKLGRLKAKLQNAVDKRALEAETARAIEGTRNLDVTDKPNRGTWTEVEKAKDFGVKAYLNTIHATRALDAIDGYADYQGWNAQKARMLQLAEQRAKLNASALVDGALEEIQEAIGNVEMDEQWNAAVMAHIRVREGSPDAAQAIIDRYLGGKLPALTDQQAKFIDILHKYTNRYADDMAMVYEDSTGKIFPWREYYVLPLKYEKGEINIPPSDLLTYQQGQGGQSTTKTEQGSTKERKGAGAALPRIDTIALFNQHISTQQWFIHLQPEIDNIAPVVMSEEFTGHAGKIVSDYWRDYIDTVARRGWKHSATFDQFLRERRSNISQAILGYKLTSIAMQPMAIFDAMSYLVPKYGARIGVDLVSEFTKAWAVPGYAEAVINNSDALKLRTGGELALEEIYDKLKGDDSMRAKFVRGGMGLLQGADVKTAAGVRAAIKKTLERNGFAGDIEAEADFIMNLTQGSADITARPLVLSSGEGARMWFTFQTFAMNRWGIIINDLILGKIAKGDMAHILAGFVGLALLMLADNTEDEARKLIAELTGKDMKDVDSSAFKQIALFVPSQIPVVGGAVDKYVGGRSFGSLEAPLVRTVEGGAKGVGKIVKGIEKGDSEKIALGAVGVSEFVLSFFYGMPGTAQLADFAEATIKEKK